TAAGRVVPARRAGVTDAALVASSMLLEAGISAVAGVIVFVVALPFVDNADAPLWPLVIFGAVLAILVQPRVFRPLAHKVLPRFGYTKELPDLRGRTLSGLLVFYAGTWVLGGFALWLLLRSVGAHPEPATVVFLGGTAAVGAIVAVLFVFAPSGLGPREASMYGLLLAVDIPHELWRALSFAFGMTWEILWALILGFGLSAVVQAVVSKREMRRLMPDDSPRTLLVASGLGAASSSCSYASVALARSLVRKGADFTAAMAFEIASTNLVIELGIVMALLLGWRFVVGEFVGGPLMIVLVALLFRVFLKRRLVDEARAEAEKGRLGSMEG